MRRTFHRAILRGGRRLLLTAALGVAATAVAEHKPFVLVPVPDPATDAMVTGHVLDLDPHNRACGWYENAGGDRVPFFFDGNATALGATTILPLPSGAAHAEARGMWETQPPTYPRLVGVAYNSTMTRAEAVTWEYVSGAWTVASIFNTSQNHNSVANAVSKGCDCDPNASCDPLIAGHRDDQGTSGTDTLAYRRLWDAGTVDYFDVVSAESWGADINACGIEVGRLDPGSGTERAYWWVPADDDYDVIHPSDPDIDASAALAINSVVETGTDGPDIVGWVEEDGDVSAALWRNKNNFMQLVIVATTPGQDFFARDVNNQSEIVVSASEIEDEFNSGAWIYKDVTGASTYSLTGLVQFPAVFPVPTAPAKMHRVTSIANNLHIGGSYVPGDASQPMPCLLIPYDVDNDSLPDFRRIVNGHEDDVNGNWIPDDFEGIRPGLYSVALEANEQRAHKVENMHAVRLHLDYNADSSLKNLIFDQGTICQRFDESLEVYGVNGGDAGERKEIITMIRSVDPADPGQDSIPPDSTSDPDELTRQECLDLLAEYAKRYARCIDYIQFGNEFFSGPGQYHLSPEDLPSCDDCDNGGWCGGVLRDLPSGCLATGCEAVLGWMAEQVNAARYASALAGRPLRFVSPAANIGTVRSGHVGDRNGDLSPGNGANRSAFAMDCLVRFANQAGAAVDLHCHYIATSEVLNSGAIWMLVNPNTSTNWPVPDMVTSLEWSPKVDKQDDWWPANYGDLQRFFPPTAQDPQDFADWDELVADWEGSDDFQSTGFQFAEVLAEFSDKGYLHACYGGYRQGDISDDGTNATPDHWVVPVIRAEKVKCLDNWTSCWINDSTEKFTALKGRLETAALPYSTALGGSNFMSERLSCECYCDPDCN